MPSAHACLAALAIAMQSMGSCCGGKCDDNPFADDGSTCENHECKAPPTGEPPSRCPADFPVFAYHYSCQVDHFNYCYTCGIGHKDFKVFNGNLDVRDEDGGGTLINFGRCNKLIYLDVAGHATHPDVNKHHLSNTLYPYGGKGWLKHRTGEDNCKELSQLRQYSDCYDPHNNGHHKGYIKHLDYYCCKEGTGSNGDLVDACITVSHVLSEPNDYGRIFTNRVHTQLFTMESDWFCGQYAGSPCQCPLDRNDANIGLCT
eukprot:360822-Chlamydomonas_euryale.AAC.2